MNEQIKELWTKVCQSEMPELDESCMTLQRQAKFSELIVEAVLDQVKERAYYTGDRDWSDDVDRPWIQLEFGYGSLHDAKHSGVGK